MAASRTLAAAAALLAAALVAQPAGAEPIRIGHSTWVGYGPFFIAKEQGYFDEEGVEVELIIMEDPKLRFGALAAGRLDAIATTIDTMPLYLTPDGTTYQYIFAVDDSKGGDGIVAHKDIETIADLKGKKVAFAEGSVSQFYLNVLLREAGLSEDDVEAVNMTAGDAGSAFVTEQVDAAVTWEPWLTRGRQAEHGHLLADSSDKPGLISDVVLAPAELIESRRDEFRALARAWHRAVDFAKESPDEANEIMARGVGGWLKDPDVFAETLEGIALYDAEMNRTFFGTPEAPGPAYDTVQNALDIWSDFGLLRVEVTPQDLINHSILAE